MSFVFVNCTYETFTPANSGAICTWIWEQCQAASAEGIEPIVISRSSPHPQYQRSNTFFVDYPKLPTNRWMGKFYSLQQRLAGWAHVRHKEYCRRIAEAIREAGAAHLPLVLSNDMELAVFLREWFPDAYILHHFQNANTSPDRFRRRFAKSVNVATACSDYAARWNENYFGFAAGSIQTIYNGANTEHFRPMQDWNNGKPLINFVGKTDPIKGPDILLKAAIKLSQKTSDFKIQIVGRKYYDREEVDQYQSELKEMAQTLSARGVEVHFTGWVDRANLPQVLGRAHIHVVPSRWDEPSALTIYEGMAAGMAVVGSRTGGTPEIIGDAGLLFARDDSNELAVQLEKLVSDASLRKLYGQKARQRAQSLTWEHAWRQLSALLPLGQTETRAVQVA